MFTNYFKYRQQFHTAIPIIDQGRPCYSFNYYNNPTKGGSETENESERENKSENESDTERMRVRERMREKERA